MLNFWPLHGLTSGSKSRLIGIKSIKRVHIPGHLTEHPSQARLIEHTMKLCLCESVTLSDELTPSILNIGRIQRVWEVEQGKRDRNEMRNDVVVAGAVVAESMVGTMDWEKPFGVCSNWFGIPGKEERSVERTGLQELVVQLGLWLEVLVQRETVWWPRALVRTRLRNRIRNHIQSRRREKSRSR